MPVEKVLVPIALQGAEIGPPVPQPVFLVSVVTQGDEQRLVLWKRYEGGFLAMQVYKSGVGPIEPSQADLISAGVGDAFYNWLLNYIGIQGQFEGAVPD